jgi:hypothetical protein
VAQATRAGEAYLPNHPQEKTMPAQTAKPPMLKANIGRVDQVLRIGVGLVLLALVAMQQIGLWGLVGFVPLLTGLVRFCPLYGLLGFNTCPRGRTA